jgi:hypothetical protein
MPPTTNRDNLCRAYAAACVKEGLCLHVREHRLAKAFKRVLSLKDHVPWKAATRFITDIENLKWYLRPKRERNEAAKMLSAVSSICTPLSFCAALRCSPVRPYPSSAALRGRTRHDRR